MDHVSISSLLYPCSRTLNDINSALGHAAIASPNLASESPQRGHCDS